ncbi:MAG: hypothetical protein QXS48_01400 [Candidatus Aenigmatarchaeota archaeon]
MGKGQTRTLVYLAIILFVIGAAVNFVPIYWEGKSLVQYLSDITGLPAEDLFFPNFIWMFMLPLIGSTAMVLAIINMATGWFVTDKNLNLLIALSWVGVLMATPLRWFIWGMFGILGMYSIIVWTVIFIVGSAVMTKRFLKKPEKFLVLTTTKSVAELTQKLQQLLIEHQKAVQARQWKKAADLKSQIDAIQAELQFIERKQREMATGAV